MQLLEELGPALPEILQLPSTASSGRRLIVTNCGGTYSFLPSAWFNSRSIGSPLFAVRSVIPTTPTPRCRHARIVQNRQKVLRSYPTLHIDLLARNPPCGLKKCIVLTSTRTELTGPMRRNLNSDRGGPQVCHVAQKLHRTLPISVF